MLFAIFTLFCLAIIIINEIHKVNEISRDDIESYASKEFAASYPKNGLNKCTIEINLPKPKDHIFWYQDHFLEGMASKESLRSVNPSIYA